MRFINDSHYLMNRFLVQAHLESRAAMDLDASIYFQDEHTLVLPGGRDVPEHARPGMVPSIFDPGERYLVRVTDAARFHSSDVIVEYNMPNVVHLTSSGFFVAEVLRKIVYAPSLPFAYACPRARSVDVLTNFVDAGQPRRAALADKLRARIPGYRNVQGVYSLDGLRGLYASARIVVNPHQTWHHHSIEEFRVLPALSQGCIVISEDVPLREHIPYHPLVIWCRYEEIPDRVEDVLRHYDVYFEDVHQNSRLASVLSAMRAEFEVAMDRVMAPLWNAGKSVGAS